MTKRQLIDEITHLNPTAGAAFLADFEDSDLAEYLEHLQWVASPPAQPATPADPAHDAEALAAQADPPPGEPVTAAVANDRKPSSFAQNSPQEELQTWLF